MDTELSIEDGNVVDLSGLINDPDADPENELQELVPADHELTISGRNTVILPDNVEDADADPENEIQDMQLTGHILTITLNGTPTEIDLEPYMDNTDEPDLANVPGYGNDTGGNKIVNISGTYYLFTKVIVI